MAEGVRFPDEMFEKPTVHLSDKIMLSDIEDSKKTKWWTMQTIFDWILSLFARKDAANITGGTLTSWQTALKQNSFTDKILDARGLNVFEIEENGIYQTDGTCSNLPGTNKVGILKVVINGTLKYLSFETWDISDIQFLYLAFFDGSAWETWAQLGGGSGTDSDAIHKSASGEIHGLTASTTLNDADEFIGEISIGGVWSKIRITFSLIKSTLKTYFETGLAFTGSISFKGTSTGKNIIAVANTSANDYTNTLPSKDGTFAMTDDIASGRLETYSTTPTATSTTTLTAASNYMQYFTGILGQIVVMPAVSTLVLGFQFKIVNNSTGILTVNSSGSNLIITLQTWREVILTCIAITGTGVESWSVEQKLPALTTNRVWMGINNVPTETDTAVSSLFVGDYTNDFPALITASNWLNNVTSAITGQLGDRAIGIDELGSISESFYTQYGWTRDFINPFITDATLIAALQTSGNWTRVSDIISTYNAAKGDRNQAYYANGIFYFCYGTALHTWIRYGNLPYVEVYDPTYMTKPQIEVGKLDNSTIIIESKFDVIGITLKAETTTAGNISIGSADGLSDIVAVTALPTVIGQRKQLLYIINPDYPTTANRTLYVTISSAASVELTILTQKMFS